MAFSACRQRRPAGTGRPTSLAARFPVAEPEDMYANGPTMIGNQ